MRKRFFRWLYGLPYAPRIAVIVVPVIAGFLGGVAAAHEIAPDSGALALGLGILGMILAGVGFYRLAPQGFLDDLPDE
jgi:uncharacterized membrane protein